jgi:hypothetical protein
MELAMRFEHFFALVDNRLVRNVVFTRDRGCLVIAGYSSKDTVILIADLGVNNKGASATDAIELLIDVTFEQLPAAAIARERKIRWYQYDRLGMFNGIAVNRSLGALSAVFVPLSKRTLDGWLAIEPCARELYRRANELHPSTFAVLPRE